MPAGLYRERAVIDRYAAGPAAWQPLLTLWADFREVPGRERVRAGAMTGGAIGTMRLRHSAAAAGILPTDRVTVRGQAWTIIGITRPDRPPRQVELLLRPRAVTGDRVCVFYTRSKTPDGAGGYTVGWVAAATTAGDLEGAPAATLEELSGGGVNPKYRAMLTVPREAAIDALTEEDRVEIDGTPFAIRVIEPAAPHHDVRRMAVEAGAPA